MLWTHVIQEKIVFELKCSGWIRENVEMYFIVRMFSELNCFYYAHVMHLFSSNNSLETRAQANVKLYLTMTIYYIDFVYK